MSKIKIEVYTNFNNKESNINLNAIYLDNKVKYINNDKYILDLKNNILEKENNDSFIKLDFNNNKTFISVKNLKLDIKKDIKVIKIENKLNYFYVKYLLIDEDIYNEYCIKFI